MEEDLIHQSAAAYALDALSAEQEREYETHLASCPRCQEEVADFSEMGAALAYAVLTQEPPPSLRTRILATARDDRPNVVSLKPRWAYPAAAAAAVAACAAIGFGIWAVTLNSRSHGLEALTLKGATGSVIRAPGGEATLVVSGLPPAPSGKTYEVWVMRGNAASPAGLFSAASRTATVHLSRSLPSGSFVGVTLERAGGSARPSEKPLVTSGPA